MYWIIYSMSGVFLGLCVASSANSHHIAFCDRGKGDKEVGFCVVHRLAICISVLLCFLGLCLHISMLCFLAGVLYIYTLCASFEIFHCVSVCLYLSQMPWLCFFTFTHQCVWSYVKSVACLLQKMVIKLMCIYIYIYIYIVCLQYEQSCPTNKTKWILWSGEFNFSFLFLRVSLACWRTCWCQHR